MKGCICKKVRWRFETGDLHQAGLDQRVNSCRQPIDAAPPYIKSQAHDGWTLIRVPIYDGGLLRRVTGPPDIQRLPDDIRARKY